MLVKLERAEEIINAWRGAAPPVVGWDNPAGPLLMSEYAESEITMAGLPRTQTCGTDCSGSRTRMCC